MTTARPILFSAPMVRALLEGRKTQTRRLAKGVPEAPGIDEVVHANPKHAAPYLDAYCGGKRTPQNPRGMTQWWCWWTRDDRPCEQFKNPYGVPGDLLWVRETFAQVTNFPPAVRYHATDDVHELRRKRPGIHMPRWASRLTLEITDVRVERLQDISKADVIAEGITERDGCPIDDVVSGWHEPYAQLWDKLNGPGAWDANPWIVALSFTAHKSNVDTYLSQRAEAA